MSTSQREILNEDYEHRFFDPLLDTPEDLERALSIQKRINVEYLIKENKPTSKEDYMPLAMPAWDSTSLGVNRRELKALFNALPGSRGMFGRVEDIDTLAHAIGAAGGWGGLPEQYSIYLIGDIDNNNGNREYAIFIPANDPVPVNGFWSITVYNAEGHVYDTPKGFPRNINSFFAEPNEDGSYLINFTKDLSKKNAVFIDKGWTYTVRLYEPSQAVISGSYEFPKAQAVPNTLT